MRILLPEIRYNLIIKIVLLIAIFFSIFILEAFFVFAQTNKYEIEFNNLIENKSNNDKLKLLEDSALLSNDKQKSLYASENYLILAKNENRKILANGYRLVGRTYWLIGKLSLSQENNFKALKLFEQSNDSVGLAKTLNLIGVVFQVQNEGDKAIIYFEKAINEFSALHDMQGMANVYGNLSIIYRNQKKYQNALNSIENAIELYRKLDILLKLQADNSMGIALCFSYLGDIYSQLGKTDSSFYYYQKSLRIHRNINHKNGIASMLIVLSTLSIAENKFDEGEKYAKEALIISLEISNNTLLASSYEKLATIYKEQNKFEKALEFYEKFKELTDTIHKYDARAISAQYELRNEEDKFIIEKENQKNKLFYYYVIASIVIITLIIILLLLLNRYRVKSILSKQLKELNNTKDKLFSIISHDLKTPLSGFKNLSKLVRENNENLSEEEKNQYYKNFEDTSDNLLKLLDNLLNWSQIQTGKIQFYPEYLNVKDLIESELVLFKDVSKLKSINFITNLVECSIFADREMIKTVLRNLIANALKYSKPLSEINILTSVFEGIVKIEIKDEGIGISNEDSSLIFGINKKISRIGTSGEKGTGLGLILCKEFVEKNNGTIWLESQIDKGTTFFIDLPLTIEN